MSYPWPKTHDAKEEAVDDALRRARPFSALGLSRRFLTPRRRRRKARALRPHRHDEVLMVVTR